MREHLLSLLTSVAAAVGLLALSGCHEKPVPPEPIPASAPIALNHFVRAWAQTPELASGDSVKALHARESDLYVYTKRGQILVLTRDTGRLRWVTQIRSTDSGGMRPPVVLKEEVIIPTSSTLEVFEPHEGQLQRSIQLTVATRSNAIGAGNVVFLGGDTAGSGRVVAVDVTRRYRPTVWELLIPKGGLASTPALFDNVLYIGGGDGNVYAVAAANREAVWPLKDNVFKTEGPIVADLAVDDSGVYVPSTDSRFYCLNRGSGRLKWQYFASRPLSGDPVLTATQVYLPVGDDGIACFGKGEGEATRHPLWLAPGMTQFLAEDAQNAYLLRGADNVIVAVDKQTGEQRFESNRRDLTAFASNASTDGTIFAASKTNRILAIKPVLRPGVVGELVWDETDVTDSAVAMAR
jgi:outer membrane protein assembly factor BamB